MKTTLRVIVFEQPEVNSGIYEVYVDDDGKLVSFASQPVTMKWDGNNAAAVLAKIKEMREAIVLKRWLKPEDFGLAL